MPLRLGIAIALLLLVPSSVFASSRESWRDVIRHPLERSAGTPHWLQPLTPHDATSLLSQLPRETRQSLPGDELWWDGFDTPTTDGAILSIVEYGGSLVIGGTFTRIGDVSASNIARWDGSRWHSLGAGTDGHVLALAIYDGKLIAAGTFSSAGQVQTSCVAAWNGTEWSSLGAGLHHSILGAYAVRCLAVMDGSLVAGGAFTHSGNDSVGPVARWDGTSWTAMGYGIRGEVSAVGIAGIDIYIGGHFSLPGVSNDANIARWNGAAWEVVGGGVHHEHGGWAEVSAIHEFQGSVIVGGLFDRAEDTPVSNIARWDGSQWHDLSPEWLFQVRSLAVIGERLYVGTSYATQLHSWDGASWIDVNSIAGSVLAMHSSGDDLIAGGWFEARGEDGAPVAFNVTRLSGGLWHGFEVWDGVMLGLQRGGGGIPFLTSMVEHHGEIVATGSFRYAGTSTGWKPLEPIAVWDGGAWHSLDAQPPYAPMTLHSDGIDLFAGGLFPCGTDTVPCPVLRYDGSQWIPFGKGAFGARVLESFQANLWATGYDIWQEDASSVGIYRWTGAEWQTMGAVWNGDGPQIYDMVEFQGELIVAGRFSEIDGVQAANIAAWDGEQWRQMGSGLTADYGSEVSSLTVHNGALLATGPSLRLPSGSTAVVRWTGSYWEPMGTLYSGGAAVASVGGDLFAGGGLYGFGLEPPGPHGILRWGKAGWETLGSGTNGPVWFFAEQLSSVYMGGQLSSAGGHGSFAIARWDGLPAPTVSPAFLPAAPNPFRSTTAFRYQVPSPGHVRVTIFDLHGREVVVLVDEVRPAGAGIVTWDGRNGQGARAAAGVYFVKASLAGGYTTTWKVVLVR